MKIRKKETSIGIVGKILNAFNSSKQDTYSCDYINKIPMRMLSNGTNIDNLKSNGIYGILNATGTLPSLFTSDNNIFIHNYIWDTDWGRQILYDVRANDTFSRQLVNGTWSGWRKVTQTDM